jgi:hypothetical protein
MSLSPSCFSLCAPRYAFSSLRATPPRDPLRRLGERARAGRRNSRFTGPRRGAGPGLLRREGSRPRPPPACGWREPGSGPPRSRSAGGANPSRCRAALPAGTPRGAPGPTKRRPASAPEKMARKGTGYPGARSGRSRSDPGKETPRGADRPALRTPLQEAVSAPRGSEALPRPVLSPPAGRGRAAGPRPCRRGRTSGPGGRPGRRLRAPRPRARDG